MSNENDEQTIYLESKETTKKPKAMRYQAITLLGVKQGLILLAYLLPCYKCLLHTFGLVRKHTHTD